MGDLEFGFEEMQGVKLGYLVIQGKQMFALSQVFTDLLKNIPRTTVHKRMDHLNVKKHHCDLDELRKLKAINSVAFHAAKCTLISREDVEALYLSCKTERVLKSNKKRTKTKQDKHHRHEDFSTESRNGLWKEKLWLSFGGVSPQLSTDLPQIYSKSIYHNFPPLSQTACRAFKNYETVQIPGKCVEFNEKLTLFRSGELVNRKPVVSAISAPSDSELLYKRKRRSDRHFGKRKRRCRQVLLVPKCCKPKAFLSSHFHPDRELYLDRHFQESCSSDTECSSANDSDFGSSLSANSSTSSSSNSESSEDEAEDSLSCSSEESSDAESSSQSDSSSVSSRVSMQSIRFRRARFSTLSKAPLVLQPTFHYRSSFQHKNGTVPGSGLDCDKGKKTTVDASSWKLHRHKNGDAWDGARKLSPPGLRAFSGLNKAEFLQEPKTVELINGRNTDFSFTSCANGKVLHQRDQDKDPGVHIEPESKFSEGAIYKKDVKAASCIKQQPSPLKQVKTENEDALLDPDSTGKAYLNLNHVKIKLEDTYDEYEYANHGTGHQRNWKYYTNQREDGVPLSADGTTDARKASPPPKQEPSSTLTCQGEYKNGTRLRKSYRTPAWAKKTEIVAKTSASATKVDRTPRKCASKRATNQSTSLKPTFNFMANFPCPPSLMVGTDGDLIPAYSLNSFRTNKVPHPTHPVWRWQLGTSVIPAHLNQRLRKNQALT